MRYVIHKLQCFCKPLFAFTERSRSGGWRGLLLFLFSLWGLGGLVTAQNTIYPVQLQVQMLPPFTPCLSDYTNNDYSRLRVIALQRDMTQPNYRFALKLTVKQGNSIYLQSDVSQLSVGNDFKVNPGVATIIFGTHLNNIFSAPMLKQPKNYETNGFCLPEGYYEIIFQAFDANNTTLPVSDAASTFVYFQKGRPPYPVTPAYGACINENTQVINFTWTDETANLRTNKRYRLEIFEIIDSVSFQSITTRQLPIITQEYIMSSFYMMSVIAGTLQKGKSYAWRVQAVNFIADNYNKAALANDGYSELFMFEYGACINPFEQFEEQPPVIGKTLTNDRPELRHIFTSDFSAHAVWKNEDKYDYFLVEYRRKSNPEREWVSTMAAKTEGVPDLASDSLLLSGIGREITYEVRVQGHFPDGKYSQYSNILEFKLEREEKPECGSPLPELTSTQDIAQLQAGDEISANGYTVTITEVRRNADGSFVGYGKVNSPIFKVIPLRVKFDGIRVNTNKQLTKGEVVTVYNLATSATLDLNGVLNKNSSGRLLNEQPAAIPEVPSLKDLGSEYNGSVVKTPSGVVYVIDEQGGQTSVGKINPNINIEKGTVSSALGKVTFDIIPDQKMIIDPDAGAFAGKGFIHEHYETLVDGYKVPWTLVPTGQMRLLKATVSGLAGKYQPENILFVCTDNVVLEKHYNGNNTFTLKVFGGDNHTAQGIYAVVPDNGNNYNTIGKILLAHYTEKTLDVAIVPVNREKSEINEQTIKSELNNIYNPVGIKVNVTVEEKFAIDPAEYDFLEDGLAVEGTDTWTNETTEMKLLKYLYKKSGRTIEKQTAYLFVLKEAENPDVQGDMPRGKQVGYLFGTEANNARLIAHELGHGAFALEHTFNYGVGQNSTDNLMDYKGGIFLTCWQWELLHQPRMVWSFLEGDEGAMALHGMEGVNAAWVEPPKDIPAYALSTNDLDFIKTNIRREEIAKERWIYYFKDGSSFEGGKEVRLKHPVFSFMDNYIPTNCPVYYNPNTDKWSFTNPKSGTAPTKNPYYKSFNTQRGNLVIVTGTNFEDSSNGANNVTLPTGMPKEGIRYSMTLPNDIDSPITVSADPFIIPNTFTITDVNGNIIDKFESAIEKEIMLIPGGTYNIHISTPDDERKGNNGFEIEFRFKVLSNTGAQYYLENNKHTDIFGASCE